MSPHRFRAWLAICAALLVPTCLPATPVAAQTFPADRWSAGERVAVTSTAAGRSTPTSPPRPTNAYVTHVATRDRVVFITVDDGWYRDPAFLALVRAKHLPVSIFLTNAAASGKHAAYFRALVAAGAVIENHTLSHPRLTHVSTAVRTRQICAASAHDRTSFGSTPALLRPPYGDWNPSVVATAHACGMRAVIGWDAVMPSRGRLQTWGGGQRLHPGDIVLLHFTPGLTHQVVALLGLIARQHLRPAPLESYV